MCEARGMGHTCRAPAAPTAGPGLYTRCTTLGQCDVLYQVMPSTSLKCLLYLLYSILYISASLLFIRPHK